MTSHFVAAVTCGGNDGLGKARESIRMKHLIFLLVLPVMAAMSLQAQEFTAQDSLHLQQLLGREGEIELNPNALQELRRSLMPDTQHMDMQKPWMEPDFTLPNGIHTEPRPKVRLTLRPYSANTPYNWDPVYQCKIDIDHPKGMTVPRLAGCASPSGYSLMAIFTREFWDRKGKRRRARTLEVLRDYGDSITVHVKRPKETVSAK